ncbi:MAG: DEAD/DEAH box helicase [Chloracidobacterium sp.]|nr:DEAD/DEAH box helicase [Chloracidobacterium sp.]
MSKNNSPALAGNAVYDPRNPLIVQSDRSLLLEVHSPLYEAARAAISPFAELEKSPEHIHTYRLTPLSLWNASAAGLQARAICDALTLFAKYPVPQNVLADVMDLAGRWGRVQLVKQDGGQAGELRLESKDAALLAEVARHKSVKPFLGEALSPHAYRVPLQHRGALKQALIAVGWPVEDLAGYVAGEPLEIDLRANQFTLRDYQKDAAEIFYYAGSERGGSGVIVLPCGAGKTIVGLAAIALAGQSTLILTTSRTSAQQWRRELLEKTTLRSEQIVEYQSDTKQIGPVTLTTYQMLTYRPDKTEDFPHLRLFDARNWGLIIYDEVHMLPAPVFRITAEVQARRRLGLTATLVREDGREGDVFSLIGPKRYDIPWRDLEERGWIATARCSEVRCRLPRALRMEYATAPPRAKFRLASENPSKLDLTARIIARHADAPVLIIGQYLEQLQKLAARLHTPLVTGKTPQRERERLYHEFRNGMLRTLALSKVGNFALDLPDAEVLVQVSGTFGSRQEEAQRLGRVLRPKPDGRPAHFYSLVSRETDEEDFAHHRQLFLTEQGYSYQILDEEEL